jgi:hypothetical protein
MENAGTQQVIKLRAERPTVLPSPTRCADLEQRLRQQLNKSNFNLKDRRKRRIRQVSAGSSATVEHRQIQEIQVVGQQKNHDVTPKLLPGLSGIAIEAGRL